MGRGYLDSAKNIVVFFIGMVMCIVGTYHIVGGLTGTSGLTDMEYTEEVFGKVFYAWELQVNTDVQAVDLVRDYEVPVAAAS
jgi:hypothetical protein